MRRLFILTAMGLVSLGVPLSSVSAVTLTMGNNVGVPNSSDGGIASDVRTDIDLLNPANATGTVDTATFGWSSSGCTNAVKIKFFRRSGDTLTLTDERGPFNGNPSSTVALSPAVNIQVRESMLKTI